MQQINSKISLRLILFFMLIVWCFGFSFESLFPNSSLAAISYPLLKHAYGEVCHQIPSKTFVIENHRLLVCARCTGIYLGALVFSFLSLFFFRKLNLGIKLLYISLVPILIDVIFSSLDIYKYSKLIAFGTGIFFGSIVFIYILTTLENNFVDKKPVKNG
jgi:uncharacterized membrane protein